MDELQMTEEVKVLLREKQTELINLIEALEKLVSSKEWNVVRELVFDKSLAAIERQILNESLGKVIDTNKLYKLQGEWAWSKQYSDIARFIETLKKQLQEIKTKLT